MDTENALELVRGAAILLGALGYRTEEAQLRDARDALAVRQAEEHCSECGRTFKPCDCGRFERGC